MSPISDLARLRALSHEERRWLAHALVLLPLARASLGALGLRRTQSLLGPSEAAAESPRTADPARVARMVSVAIRRGPFRVKCLPAALTLQALLARAGIASDLRLGVRKRGTRLEAHAWIEHRGVALMEDGDVVSEFAPFDCAIPPRSRGKA